MTFREKFCRWISRNIYWIAACSAFIAILLAIGVINIGRATYKVSHWKTTNGTILRKTSRVIQTRRGVRHGGTEHITKTKVTYRYHVDGLFHLGNRLYPGSTMFYPSYGNNFYGPAITALYQVGQKVTVSYNPARPDQATLNGKNPLPLVMVVLCFLAASVIPVYVYGRMIIRKTHGKPAKWINAQNQLQQPNHELDQHASPFN